MKFPFGILAVTGAEYDPKPGIWATKMLLAWRGWGAPVSGETAVAAWLTADPAAPRLFGSTEKYKTPGSFRPLVGSTVPS
jgi:hypothetical protein